MLTDIFPSVVIYTVWLFVGALSKLIVIDVFEFSFNVNDELEVIILP